MTSMKTLSQIVCKFVQCIQYNIHEGGEIKMSDKSHERVCKTLDNIERRLKTNKRKNGSHFKAELEEVDANKILELEIPALSSLDLHFLS